MIRMFPRPSEIYSTASRRAGSTGSVLSVRVSTRSTPNPSSRRSISEPVRPSGRKPRAIRTLPFSCGSQSMISPPKLLKPWASSPGRWLTSLKSEPSWSTATRRDETMISPVTSCEA
jgi:hypothetical protein